MSYQGQIIDRDPMTGALVTEPHVWYVADGSDIQDLQLTGLEASGPDQFVYFKKSDKKLHMEAKDGAPKRLIICAFYDRVV